MRIFNFRNIYIYFKIPANTLDLDVVILIRPRNEADAGRFVIFVHSTCNNSSLLIICICNTRQRVNFNCNRKFDPHVRLTVDVRNEIRYSCIRP